LREPDEAPDMTATTPAQLSRNAAMPVLIALAATHLLNDMMQSLIPAICSFLPAIGLLAWFLPKLGPEEGGATAPH
jgi:hypothetical protein